MLQSLHRKQVHIFRHIRILIQGMQEMRNLWLDLVIPLTRQNSLVHLLDKLWTRRMQPLFQTDIWGRPCEYMAMAVGLHYRRKGNHDWPVLQVLPHNP
jgi:hypothetical protein